MSNARIKNAFDEAIFLMDQSIAYFESAKVLVDSPSEKAKKEAQNASFFHIYTVCKTELMTNELIVILAEFA